MEPREEAAVRRFGDGLAAGADVLGAAEAAARQALDAVGGQRPDLACVFVCHDDPELAAAAGVRAMELAGAATAVGCTGAGVIGDGRGVEAASAVSVWLAVLPGVRARSFHLEVMRTPEGMNIIGLPVPGDDDRVTVLLADPYSFPVDGFVAKANEAVPGQPIVGGLAIGTRGPGSTRLFLDGRALDRGAVGVVLGGAVAARSLVSQGCRPVGPAMTVTASAGNTLLGLAGEPALTKLQEIVAELPPAEQALVGTGLSIGIAMDEYADEHDRGDFLVRGIVGADRDRGGLVVGDLVDVGRTVRFQVRDADAADDELRTLLGRFRSGSGLGDVGGALLVSCNGRGAALFPDADHDVAAVRRELAAAGVGGFFAGGEIGPVGGRNHVHGFTASILVFGAEADADTEAGAGAGAGADG